jgi:hypothetical protein
LHLLRLSIWIVQTKAAVGKWDIPTFRTGRQLTMNNWQPPPALFCG